MNHTDPTTASVREQLLDALDFSYCQGLGYAEPAELLAAYDRERVAVVSPPPSRAALRDRIRRAVCEAEGFAWDTDMLEPDEYGEVADAVLAVLGEQADRAADDLAIARATNRRLNHEKQRLESELASYRRAITKWEISEHGTYVPLRSLSAIAKAAGLPVPERWELHYQRVERLESELRRLAVEAHGTGVPQQALPARGDQFEAWLKVQRDNYRPRSSAWNELDYLLDLYRLHADTGTPLGEHVCEGKAVGGCECPEPAAATQQQPDTARRQRMTSQPTNLNSRLTMALVDLTTRWDQMADYGETIIGAFEGPTAATLNAEVEERSHTYRKAATDVREVLRTGRIPHDLTTVSALAQPAERDAVIARKDREYATCERLLREAYEEIARLRDGNATGDAYAELLRTAEPTPEVEQQPKAVPPGCWYNAAAAEEAMRDEPLDEPGPAAQQPAAADGEETLPPPEGPEYTPCVCDHIEPDHDINGRWCSHDGCECALYRPTPPASLHRSEDDCPGFPERCPNLRPVDPNPPVHLGGIRCGCADTP
ncbi:hypothetical protein [Streptomyces misionensis]|uniref:hypothetical protein n=1 Tax=Streptomyces misionensis TaxID=67331 RepID=UPI003684C337